jgi:hypothetical protein
MMNFSLDMFDEVDGLMLDVRDRFTFARMILF